MDAHTQPRVASRMHALQVRAFIEAAEVVDADPDTIEDILDGYNEEVLVQDEDESDDEDDASAGINAESAQGGDQSEEEYEILLEEGKSNMVLRIKSPLCTASVNAVDTWENMELFADLLCPRSLHCVHSGDCVD